MGKEKEKKDSDGILLEYDVIVCGTGLIQSIISSALSRAGFTVLHCDGLDYYGELDAVWTLPYLLQLQKQEDKQQELDNTVVEKEEEEDDEDDELVDSMMMMKKIPLQPKGVMSTFHIHSIKTKQQWFIEKNKTKVKTPYGI